MNHIFIFLSAVSLMFLGDVVAPNEALKTAIEKNDAKAIVAFCDDQVLLSMNERESVYSNAQAEQVVKKFFTDNPNGKYKYLFKAKPNQESTFSIGTYETSTKSYRVTIQFKKSSSRYLIESITVE